METWGIKSSLCFLIKSHHPDWRCTYNLYSIIKIFLFSPSPSLPILTLTAKAAVTWSGFLFISLCSPLKLCVCVCVCVCGERERKREREIGVEALWKVWDYFLQDFNWDIKTPFGCEKWRGKCVLKLGCWLNVLEPEDHCSVLLSPHFS